MLDQDDQKARESRSRLDLAGRLFRPNWRLSRGSRRLPVQPSASRATLHGDEASSAGQHARDVLCGGMYRACSTWQYEVAAHLIEHHLGGRRLGYLTGQEYAALLSDETSRTRKPGEQPVAWRVVKSHDADRSFAWAIAHERAIAVYAYRDVREVVFSLMHKRGLTFEQLLRQGMIHQILANDRFWMARADVLVQRYEDLLAEPTRGVIELARHLGITLEESEAARIAAEYSHESNRARTEALRRRLQEAGVDLDNAANAQICDPKTLLHWNHIRQGSSRSWRTLADTRQRRMLARLCGHWLASRGYPADSDEAATARLSFADIVRAEVDLVVGRTNFLIRNTSWRYPRTARAIKRILGLRTHTPAGATIWGDALSPHLKPRTPGDPHVAATKRSDTD